MLSNISKVLIAHISFTTVINNGGIGKGIGGTQKGTKKNYITFCNLLCGVGDEKKGNQNRGPQIILPLCPKKCSNFSQLRLFLP